MRVGRLTMSRVAAEVGVCPATLKVNVVNLLKVLPVEERVVVMEHMLSCKKQGGKKIRVFLDDLPVKKDYQTIEEFLGVTKEELLKGSRAYSRKLKKVGDVYEAFKLKKELVDEVIDELMKKKMREIIENVDLRNPASMLEDVSFLPRDKPEWILKLFRRHGFTVVWIEQWIAADMLVSKGFERKSLESAMRVLGRLFGPQ